MTDFKRQSELQNILDRPTVINKMHESLFRSYGILNKVEKWLKQGVPHATILEWIECLRTKPLEAEWKANGLVRVEDDKQV